MDRYLTNLIRQFVKHADDMGMNQGDVHWGNRGVVWHRFNAGAFSRLPEGLSNSLVEQTKMFKSNYQQFATNPKTGKPYTDFTGMIFSIYAEDRSITKDIDAQIPKELRKAADIVKQYEIKLPPLSEKEEKAIGGPQWISHYAYAWRDRFSQDVTMSEERSSPRSILQMTNEIHKKYEHGPLVVRPTQSGFGLFIDTNQGNLIPIYIGQSAAGLTKYFAGNIAPNQSNVYMPDGPHGRITPARAPKNLTNRGDDLSSTLQQKDLLYRFKILPDGTIGAEKDRFVPFSAEQIESIVPRINSNWYIRPAKDTAGVTIDMGPWRMSDRLVRHLSQTGIPDGFEALYELRSWLEQVKPGLHTPAEGFKVITIGPIFSNAMAGEDGQTVGHSNFVTDITRVNTDRLENNTFVPVRREIQWVVVANEFSEARMNAMGISSARPAARSQGEAERSPVYKNPMDAITYVKSKYLANSPSGENILNEMTASVRYAQKALENAMNTNTQTPASSMPVKNITPVDKSKQPDIFQNEKQPQTVTPTLPNITSSTKKWISRYIMSKKEGF